jgi:hypothetical protein
MKFQDRELRIPISIAHSVLAVYLGHDPVLLWVLLNENHDLIEQTVRERVAQIHHFA